MQSKFYFLSPVEVMKVTSQNLAEVAEWCGGEVATTESRRVAGRMDSYVWVPTPKGSSISWAFPGMFITKRLVRTIKDELRITYAVFRKDYFEKNYFDSPTEAVDQTWAQKDPKKAHKPKLVDGESQLETTNVNVSGGEVILDGAGEVIHTMPHEPAKSPVPGMVAHKKADVPAAVVPAQRVEQADSETPEA